MGMSIGGQFVSNVKEAILKNCLLCTGDDGSQCEVWENCGDMCIKFPNGTVKRSRRSANGVDLLVPMPDGGEMRIVL